MCGLIYLIIQSKYIHKHFLPIYLSIMITLNPPSPEIIWCLPDISNHKIVFSVGFLTPHATKIFLVVLFTAPLFFYNVCYILFCFLLPHRAAKLMFTVKVVNGDNFNSDSKGFSLQR